MQALRAYHELTGPVGPQPAASEARVAAIVAASGDAVLEVDREDRIAAWNAGAARLFGYSVAEAIGAPVALIVPPERREERAQLMERLHRGEQIGDVETVRRHRDGRLIDVSMSVVPVVDDAGQFAGTAAIVRDISARKQAERRVREREEQYRSMFEATTEGVGIFDLNGVLVEVNPACCFILRYAREEMIGHHVMEFIHPDFHHVLPGFMASIETTGAGRTQIVDVRGDGSLVPVDVHATSFIYNGRPHVLGMLRDVTEQVQAHELLEKRVAERTRELSTLLEVSHIMASTLELQPLLDLILVHLKVIVDYTGASVNGVDGDSIVVLHRRGPGSMDHVHDGHRSALSLQPSTWAMLSRGEPVLIEDVSADTALAAEFRTVYGYLMGTALSYVRSWMAVPLLLQERVIGTLALGASTPGVYEQRHAALARAIANQAAVAIENARLYARAQEAAALEERQRLARELHDSVSQALYGVTMYAEAAAALLASGEQETAATYLGQVRTTAREALQEMRLLIFELRPPILAQEGLVAALQTRLAAVEGRVAGLTAALDVQGVVRMPAAVEEALYGIAQETLNNVFKHARAQTVAVALRQEGGTVTLEIADDGVGFDPGAVRGRGGLGLGGMAERAAQIGGRLAVESTPGQGTSVRVEVTL